jgi:serine/threonine protein kinase
MSSSLTQPESARRLPLPRELLSRYELVECLSHTAQAETFMAEERESGTLHVVKVYEKTSLSGDGGERSILARVDHPAIPKVLDSIETDDTVCIIREYIEGTPLNKIELPLSIQQTRDIGVQLCDVLAYLHGLSPPVIHRDIKPQNVILDGGGKVHLIDFSISRHFDHSASKDTVYIGTKGYAPPEQYGFKQTDARTDIFSLGVLLTYLLTGQTGADIPDASQHRAIRRVLRKCIAFAPENRYPTAGAVKSALLRAEKSRAPRMIAVAVLAVSLVLIIGFAIDWLLTKTPSTPQGVVFQEPMIEAAVRVMLGIDDDTVITELDLRQVRELYISANRVCATMEIFLNDVWGIRLSTAVYDCPIMTTLDDLVMLPNIEFLGIANQRVHSIEPITHLPLLTQLLLDAVPVSDVSPLRHLQHLYSLHLTNTTVSDLSPLLDLPRLFGLGMTNLPVVDPSPLRELTGVRHLYITNDTTQMYRHLPDAPLSRLNLYISNFNSLEWIMKYQHSLQQLTLDRTRLTSLAGIEAFRNLEYLEFRNCLFDDLTPLLLLPNLKTIKIDASVVRAISAIRDEANFEIIVG